MRPNISRDREFHIAVVGVNGRFPAASNIDAYWNNLVHGVDCIKMFSDEELMARGVDPVLIQDTSYIRAGSVLEDTDRFAASFFGYSPREAELMDPQHRIFLECAWGALEDAGYAPKHIDKPVGVFASSSLSRYLLFNISGTRSASDDEFQAMIGNDKDFLASRVSYKLNLTGPSVTIQTGCSSSLVATHFAIQSLLTHQCDLAIAGGVSISVPQRTGYWYERGGICSPDGHCRPFDIDAQGTIFGDGVGIVVLKRLEDAIADRDNIYAVVRGSAVSNDGSAKAGFTAPGLDGQVRVILRAQSLASISAEEITYIETHGTGTALGDPIEVQALCEAFRSSTVRTGFCAIGSVKSNIGHLDAAAGIAGLIKVVLMLKHRRLVPTLHFKRANPQIGLDRTPFFVSVTTQEWSGSVLRAGVNSFGIGGTNAHLVLESPPELVRQAPKRSTQLICLSATNPQSLQSLRGDIERELGQGPKSGTVADIAFTLQTGREELPWRCTSVHERGNGPCNLSFSAPVLSRKKDREIGIAFMFPGGGTQYPGMGNQLYVTEPLYRETVEYCARYLLEAVGIDLITAMYPRAGNHAAAQAYLSQPSVALPAIFVTEYALAKLLMSWNVVPTNMIGHSLGEYAAACLAGVISLEDALTVVAHRGSLLEQLPRSSMLSVYRSATDVSHHCGSEISIAAVNAADQTVVAGSREAIARLEEKLSSQKIEFRRLHLESAAHCHLVDDVLPRFGELFSKVKLSQPTIPFVSTLTGNPIRPEEATSTHYWVEHFRHTVQFSTALAVLAKDLNVSVLLEVGPGRTLSGLASGHPSTGNQLSLASMRHPREEVSDLRVLYDAIGKMWVLGADIDWTAFHKGEERDRVSTTKYPFHVEGERYWITGGVQQAIRRSGNVGLMCYVPGWKRVPAKAQKAAWMHPEPAWSTEETWIVFIGRGAKASALVNSIPSKESNSVEVLSIAELTTGDEECANRQQLRERLVERCAGMPKNSSNTLRVLFFATSSSIEDKAPEVKDLIILATIADVFGSSGRWGDVWITIISSGIAQVTGQDPIEPRRSALIAFCNVVFQEYGNIECNLIDCEVNPVNLAALLTELRRPRFTARVAAVRSGSLWIPSYEQVPLVAAKEQPRERPVFLITGGLGRVGLSLARHLAAKRPCVIVITSRTELPPESQWQAYLKEHRSSDDDLCAKLTKLQMIKSLGAELLIEKADCADEVAMTKVVDAILEKHTCLTGIFHLAGITGQGILRLISETDRNELLVQFGAKVRGCEVLDTVLAGKDFDFCVLFSSTASTFGGAGLLSYSAASCILDASANRKEGSIERWLSVGWDAWTSPEWEKDDLLVLKSGLAEYSVETARALAALDSLLENVGISGQVIISTEDVGSRIDQLERRCKKESYVSQKHTRPHLANEYIAPKPGLESQIAEVWQDVLGIERVGTQDNLFELGGTSLTCLRIVAQLKKEHHIEISVTTLFEAPRISGLVQLIAPGFRSRPTGEQSRKRGERRRRRVLTVGKTSAQAE